MLNTYFTKGSSREHQFYEELVIESIQIYGFDVYYLPRTLRNEDKILGEDTLSKFNLAIPLEAYIETSKGPEGESDVLSRFGLEIRDSVTLAISKKRFNEEIAALPTNPLIVQTRTGPNEGDLIFFQVGTQREILEIKFVEHEIPFYQLDRVTMFKLKCEMFQYSNEEFNTGIPEIDNLQSQAAFDSLLNKVLLEVEVNGKILSESGGYILAEQWNEINEDRNGYATNSEFKEEAKGILNFDPSNPFGDSVPC